MVPVVNANSGVIDKFIGDAIMAIYCDIEKGAYQAIKTGIEMLGALAEFNKTKVTPLKMRIGLNSGKLFMGDIGSKFSRRDFTVIGDAVNLSSRLESAGKAYGVNFIISEDTRKLAGDSFALRKLDKIKVKGKDLAVDIFECMGYLNDDLKNIISEFEEGLNFYFNREWKKAQQKFQDVLVKTNNNDGPSLVYIERCKIFIKKPPPAKWDGTFTMTSK